MLFMKEFSFIDNEGLEIACYKWENDSKKIKGVVQLVHGMAEHAKRYDYFARKLVEAGFIVYAHDHRGHGNTAKNKEDLGYIADNEGFELQVKNVKEYHDIIKKENEDLPMILFGHSMGSFICERFIEKYSEDIDSVILCGSNGKPMQFTKAGVMVSKAQIMVSGRRAKSKLMNTLSFGSFNSAFKPNRTGFDWLCSDEAEVDKYINDDKCGFICSASFYYDFIKGLWSIHEKENLKAISKELPIFIISGDKDPVGDYGKGVIKLNDTYKEIGIKDVSYKLYKDGRHEILNEINKDEVINDVITWIERKL